MRVVQVEEEEQGLFRVDAKAEGDVGVLDPEGHLTITGRAKELTADSYGELPDQATSPCCRIDRLTTPC